MGTGRKEAASPVSVATQDINARIAGEIYAGLERLVADDELLVIVGSWRDSS